MDWDARLKWGTIAGLGGAALLGTGAMGLRVPLEEVAVVGAGAGVLGLVAWKLNSRQETAAACVVAYLQFLLFTCFYTAVTCLVARGGLPLVDEKLMAIDEALGVRLPEWIAWNERHPVARDVLALAYHTILPQTLVVIGLLGWLGGRRPVEMLLSRLLIAALITLVFYALLPAVGPPALYGYAPTASGQHFLDYFLACRSGEARTVHLIVFEGLIVFPSYHAAWAVVLAAAFWPWPRWLAVFGTLNALVIVSSATIGGHYAVDLLAGMAVGATAVALGRRGEKSCPGDTEAC